MYYTTTNVINILSFINMQKSNATFFKDFKGVLSRNIPNYFLSTITIKYINYTRVK